MYEPSLDELREIAEKVSDTAAPEAGEGFFIFTEEELLAFVRELIARE